MLFFSKPWLLHQNTAEQYYTLAVTPFKNWYGSCYSYPFQLVLRIRMTSEGPSPITHFGCLPNKILDPHPQPRSPQENDWPWFATVATPLMSTSTRDYSILNLQIKQRTNERRCHGKISIHSVHNGCGLFLLGGK